METATAPAPSTPAAAPAKSVTPSPSSAPRAPATQSRPEPPPKADPGSYRASAFDEIDRLDTASPAPHSTRPKTPPTPKKEEPAKPADPKPAPDAKTDPAAPKPADPSPVTGPSAKFQQAKELRAEYDKIHAQNKTLTEEVTRLRSTQATDNSKQLTAENATLKKRLDELESEIRYHDYTKSTEYKSKFEQPFQTKLGDVYELVQELTVAGPDGERMAKPEDFDRILQSPQEDVRRLAKEMFGDENFREVLQWRRELQDIRRNADRELKRWRDESKNRDETRTSEQTKAREEANTAYQRSTQAYIDKYGQWFGQVEGDDELNEALSKGFQTVDGAYDKGLSMEQRADKLAANRLKAAAFGRNVLTIKRLNAKVTELEAELEGYRKSANPGGEGGRTSETGDERGFSSADDEIDRLDRESAGR